MISPTALLFILIATSIALVLVVVLRPALSMGRGGRIMTFTALFIFPVLTTVMGTSEHMERSKKTEFCTSCHIMQDHGRSLYVDDPSYLAASHFQNNRVPRDKACFTCHTDYVMYGDLQAKLRGLRHVYAQYIGTPAEPIKLYTPYNNRECLHCHAGARSFEENPVHSADPEALAAMKANQTSCLECHTPAHNIAGLSEATLWKPEAEGSAEE